MSITAADMSTADVAIEGGTTARLECVERAMRLPVVAQSCEVYDRVKASSGVLAWTLGTAESTVSRALEATGLLETSLAASLDSRLCRGLSLLQDRLPLINDSPTQIYETTKQYVSSALLPARATVSSVKSVGLQKAKSLKELSWNKANELLSTQYGSKAVSGLDHGACLAERYLDYYFPPTENNTVAVTPAEEDRVAHTLGTVGHVARRCYQALALRIRTLGKDDVHEYLSLLLMTLHLTNYLNSLLPKPQEKAQSTPSSE